MHTGSEGKYTKTEIYDQLLKSKKKLWTISIQMLVLHLFYCFKIHHIREAYFLCTFTFHMLTLDLLEWQQAVDSGIR